MAADIKALKQDLTRRMDGAMETLRKEFAGLRTGRASPALLEPIRVEAYGAVTPLNQVANISVAGPGLLSVQVWDKGLTKHVESAIREANLGLNPQAEGQVILDTTRFTQLGAWQGELRVQGRALRLEPARFPGARDRSWGVGPVGEP